MRVYTNAILVGNISDLFCGQTVSLEPLVPVVMFLVVTEMEVTDGRVAKSGVSVR